MRKILLGLALSASACLAQTIPVSGIPVRFPPQLQIYLALSEDQVNRILDARSQLSGFQSVKFLRQSQLQQEISEETAKATPDALAIGVRYVEIESIRREVQTRQQATATVIQGILSANQKVKLTTLQQALSLYSTACSAVEQNLLSFDPAPQLTQQLVGFIYPAPCASAIYDPFTRIGTFTQSPVTSLP